MVVFTIAVLLLTPRILLPLFESQIFDTLFDFFRFLLLTILIYSLAVYHINLKSIANVKSLKTDALQQEQRIIRGTVILLRLRKPRPVGVEH
jgi:hypothetical protein